MRLRTLAAVVLMAAFLARVTPCESAAQEMRADCCDEGTCPDAFSNTTAHVSTSTDEPCCALAAQHHDQSRAQVAGSQTVVAPPVRTIDPAWSSPVGIEFARSDHASGSARSAPLHVLFSVFLI
jgi:hypothetical protein